MFKLDEENELLKQEYKKNNYIIEQTESESNKCIVFISGNGLYFPNEEDIFCQEILIKDRYEWRRTAANAVIRNAFAKIIYIRNIYKNWYINGINEKLNTIDKVAEWLKKETEGYDTTVSGSSAGGYAAVLLGNLIGAISIFSFSGQANLWTHRALEEYWVSKCKDNPLLNKYYDATVFIEPEIPIFYFLPNGSDEDVEQAEHFKDIANVYEFSFASVSHGVTLVNGNYKYILTKSKKELIDLYRKYEGKEIKAPLFFASTGKIEGKIYFLKYYFKKPFLIIKGMLKGLLMKIFGKNNFSKGR